MQENRKREIRNAAYELRDKCVVSRYGIIDLLKECKRMGYKLLRYPMDDENLGFVLKRDNDTVIYTNSSVRLSRENFTLAHEIGHVVLHFSSQSTFIDDNATINGKSKDEKNKKLITLQHAIDA